MKKLLLIALIMVAGLNSLVIAVETSPVNETEEQRDARMQWWREAKFGMFIHWGLYAVPAGTHNGQQIGGIGEWIMNRGKIKVHEYKKYAKEFNPTQYDPDQWVQLAKEAGMKYIVITSKHHDGFALFDSKVCDFNIVNATPYGRDLLKPLAEACRKHDIKLGFYYSQAQDWTYPGGAAMRGHWDRAQNGDMNKYIDEKAVPQVREILSNYGPIAVLWWDTPTGMNSDMANKLFELTKLQPGLITNNRLGGGYKGDTETPEQKIPATGYKDRDWETCMTMNGTWGYKSYDDNWKSTEMLLRNLIDIVSKGGNYLLNVGPTAEGLIPDPSIERLKEIGKWLKVNGESVYNTKASPFWKLPFDGRCTSKEGVLYLHVFKKPDDGKIEIPIANKISKAYMLSDKSQKLAVSSDGKNAVIMLEDELSDALDSVVVAEYEGDLVVTLEQMPEEIKKSPNAPSHAAGAAGKTVTPGTDGVVILDAKSAAFKDPIKIEGGSEKNIGYWTDASAKVSWDIDGIKAGKYEVTIEQACANGSGGSTYEISAGDQKLCGKVKETTGWSDYEMITTGKINISASGKQTIVITPTQKPGMAVMNLRRIVLKPVK